MVLRKVIKFGRSSFVISLPSSWVSRNKISKGDVIDVIEEPGSLIIEATETLQKTPRREIIIKIKNEKEIKSRIVSAYVNNYDRIILSSPKMSDHATKIRYISAGLMGLEVLEETENKIIIEDYTNLKHININSTLKRMQRTLESMMADSLKFMDGKPTEDMIFNKEADLNKLTFFLFKILKKALRPRNMKLLQLKPQELIRTWEAVIFIENVGDQVKRATRFAEGKTQNKELIPLMKETYDHFNQAMKAYFSNDGDLALEVTMNKRRIPDLGDKLFEKLKDPEYMAVIQKLNNINSNSRVLANCVLRFESD